MGVMRAPMKYSFAQKVTLKCAWLEVNSIHKLGKSRGMPSWMKIFFWLTLQVKKEIERAQNSFVFIINKVKKGFFSAELEPVKRA